MYRQIFTPTENNNILPFIIPREWYGKQIEFLVFPVNNQEYQKEANDFLQENITDKNFVSLSASSLSKEWDSEEDQEWDNLLEQMPAVQ